MGWRDIKNAAKAVVHATFQVKALYLPDRAGAPVPCVVRVHDKVQPMGIGSVDGYSAATMLESQPKIIFAAAQVSNPLPKAYVFISADEVYRLGSAEPAVAGFIIVTAALLDAAGAAVALAATGVDLTLLLTDDLAGFELPVADE